MSWEVRAARVMAWVTLVTGGGLGIACFVLAPAKVTTTERIVGHATITYEGVELVVRESFILAGIASLVLGAALWALLLLAARIASARDG
ncbi:MAG TPA: hypothetical protein VF058_00845 [Actinomycetota bacterium]